MAGDAGRGGRAVVFLIAGTGGGGGVGREGAMGAEIGSEFVSGAGHEPSSESSSAKKLSDIKKSNKIKGK